MKNKNRQNGEIKGIQGQRLSERLCRALDIQPDILPHGTLIELRGRTSVTLRGCGCVLCYNDTEVSFATHIGKVCIKGRELFCSAYREGCATVDGIIYSVSFEEANE